MSDIKDVDVGPRQRKLLSHWYKRMKISKFSKQKEACDSNFEDDFSDKDIKEKSYIQEICHILLLCLIDPVSNMLESHTLNEKTFQKSVLIYCDCCDSVLNGKLNSIFIKLI